MPVLSSTVHIARHACFKLGPDDFFASFLTHLCTVLSLRKPSGLQMEALFWQQDMPRPVPPQSPQEGQKKRFDPLR
jgi:hypothetical protein